MTRNASRKMHTTDKFVKPKPCVQGFALTHYPLRSGPLVEVLTIVELCPVCSLAKQSVISLIFLHSCSLSLVRFSEGL
jgi:hypothetical protein